MTKNDSIVRAKPWLKRLSYALAGGTVVFSGAAWFANTNFMKRVYLRSIAATVKDISGLDFGATGLSFSLLKGQATLYNPNIGSGLFKADSVNISVNTLSLFRDKPVIKNLIIVNPVSVISPEDLAKIQTKDSGGSASNWVIDRLEIHNGSIVLNYPDWGKAEVTYNIKGTGSGNRQLSLEAICPKIVVSTASATLDGSSKILLDINENNFQLRELLFDSDPLKIQATGNVDIDKENYQGSATGRLQSQHLSELFGQELVGLDGSVDLLASLSGDFENIKWTFEATGKKIETPYPSLENCRLEINASGSGSGIDINRLAIHTDESQFQIHGKLSKTDSSLGIRGMGLPLSVFSNFLRSDVLDSTTAEINGEFTSPFPMWSTEVFMHHNLDINLALTRENSPAGNFVASLTDNSVTVKSFQIDNPEMVASANGTIAFKPLLNSDGNLGFSLTSLNLDATLSTSAEQVAFTLDKWDVVDHLPISAKAIATAKIKWSQSKDLELNGNISLKDPVYFGATANTLQADVRIESEKFYLDNIQLNRNDSSANGNLWVTWASVPKGDDQIYMRYESNGIPLSEGLDAGIVNQKVLKNMDTSGLVDGWVTIKGPFDNLQLDAEATLSDGSVGGVKLPAVVCKIEMDLDPDNLKLKVPTIRLADRPENLDSFAGSLGLEGSFCMDFTKETWTGKFFGQLDSHDLGFINLPRFVTQAEFVFDGLYDIDFGALSLPEGSIALSEGQILLEDGRGINDFWGEMKIGTDSKISGQISHGNPLLENDPFIRVRAEKKTETATKCQLDVDFTTSAIDTVSLTKTLSSGFFEDISLKAIVEATLDEDGYSWETKFEKFTGKMLGQYIGQQGSNVIKSDPNGIKIELNLGSEMQFDDDGDIPTLAKFYGTLPIGDKQEADLRIDGHVDLGQAKEAMARLFGASPQTFMSGFQPIGKGELLGLRLYGTYQDLGLNGGVIVKGQLKAPGSFPYNVDELNIELGLEKRNIHVKRVEGKVLRGLLDANGTVDWDLKKNDKDKYEVSIDNYFIETHVNNFQYNYKPEGFQVWGSLDASLQKQPDQDKGVIRGTLTAENMDYTAEIDLKKMILNNTIRSIPSLQVEINNPLDSIELEIDVELSQPWTFNTNILKVKGNNRASENIKIRGTLGNPGLQGTMELVPGGRITNILPSGDIIIENGTIDFTDPSNLNPVINIQSLVDVTPFRVNVGIQGSVDSLNFLTTSTPTLRQDEIITLLLNPAVAQTLGNSAYRGNLSSAAASSAGLAGTASGLFTNLAIAPLLEPIRQTLKMDRVSAAYRTGMGGVYETDIIIGKNINILDYTIPLAGSYRQNGDIVTIGGQMELRFGNFVIHLGATGSRTLGIAPSGEIRYSWSTW
ncbi:MAG: translocation/assembly module TamB [Holophagaceae bacterium]|nr:translocation/assembly module TamB [Holophagaceae bacterium]